MDTDNVVQTDARVARSQRRRAVVASTVGTTIEWYDFFLYGTAAALVFPKLFFPGEDPYSGILLAFGTQFAGFAARPLGAAIFGHYGDRLGRKSMLITTLLIMGDRHGLIGLLPTYAAIGVAAPILLTVLRILQGIAVGGEWGGSVLLAMEWGSVERRGFMASWPQVGVPMGLLLSTGMVQLMSATTGPAFEQWGWRVPFLVSIVLVGVGLYVRLRVLESPEFTAVKQERTVVAQPVLEVLRTQWKAVLVSAFVRMSEQAPFYLFITFVLTYGTQQLKLDRSGLLTDTLIAAALGLVSVPLFGYLSDRIGRRLMYGIGIVCTGAVRVPVLRSARDPVRGARAARDRGVADLPRHAVRPAGGTDRGDLRYQHSLLGGGPRLPAGLGDRGRARAADRGGGAEEHRLEYRYLALHPRVCRGVDGRAAGDAQGPDGLIHGPVQQREGSGVPPAPDLSNETCTWSKWLAVTPPRSSIASQPCP